MHDDRPVCLLTGAGGRLGEHLCRRYAGEFRIAAVCRRRVPQVPTQTQSFIDPLHPEADIADNDRAIFVIKADLSQESEVSRVVELALARYGRIDVLVNAAGARDRGSLLSSRVGIEHMAAQFSLNSLLPVRLSHQVAMRSWKSSDGTRNRCVINLGSTGSTDLHFGSGEAVFCASKAALNILTCHMADEFAVLGARVNAVAAEDFPAVVSVEHVADAIATLLSGEMTGRILGVYDDGCEYIV